LDPSSATEFRRMIIDRLAREEGKTVLLSTHNLQEAQELCDRIAILERGKVIASDTPDNIRHLVIEDRLLKVNVAGTEPDSMKSLIRDLEATDGVHSVDSESDHTKNLYSITMRVAKEMDLTQILRLISHGGLKVLTVNTEEPTLEDAFNVITGHDDPNQRRRMTGGS
jgi:ABC-2 type transport system ATP-binding protein